MNDREFLASLTQEQYEHYKQERNDLVEVLTLYEDIIYINTEQKRRIYYLELSKKLIGVLFKWHG